MTARVFEVVSVVNPARAGMILLPLPQLVAARGKPRASGDDPVRAHLAAATAR